MIIAYEVVLSPGRKFVAIANRDEYTVTFGERYRSSEGWISVGSETVCSFGNDGIRDSEQIKKAINLAFSHFTDDLIVVLGGYPPYPPEEDDPAEDPGKSQKPPYGKQEIIEFLLNRGFINETDARSLAEQSTDDVRRVYNRHMVVEPDPHPFDCDSGDE